MTTDVYVRRGKVEREPLGNWEMASPTGTRSRSHGVPRDTLLGRVPLDTVCNLMASILVALDELRAHRIIHGDLEPENIPVDLRGHVVLSDFVLSRDSINSAPSIRSR